MRRLFVLFAALALTVPAAAESPRTRANYADMMVTVDDIKAEIEFGRDVAARIIGRYSLYDNDRLTRYVNLMGKSLAQYANRPELDFTVGILDTDVINAYAAPGGFIFITRGAISAMKDESELAGVIAHEIIHISQKHIVKEMDIKGSDTSAVAGFSRVVGGSTDAYKMAFTQAVDSAVDILFEKGYGKNDEVEADTLATVLIAQFNYDPKALVRYFKKIGEIRGNEIKSLKKLHPPFNERIRWINEIIEDGGLSGEDFNHGEARFRRYTSS
ncbi:MAG: peptidase M48 [bacterium]|nr:MAG: peptidase M48 [bacterium]